MAATTVIKFFRRLPYTVIAFYRISNRRSANPNANAATRAFVADLSTTPTRVQYRRTTHSSIYGIPVRYGAQQPGARTRDALPRETSALSPQCAQLHTQLATVPPPSLFKASVSAAAREKPVPPR